MTHEEYLANIRAALDRFYDRAVEKNRDRPTVYFETITAVSVNLTVTHDLMRKVMTDDAL